MVSDLMFRKSIGAGGSKPIKGRSTQNGGGTSRKPVDNQSNGSLKGAMPAPEGDKDSPAGSAVTTIDPLSYGRCK